MASPRSNWGPASAGDRQETEGRNAQRAGPALEGVDDKGGREARHPDPGAPAEVDRRPRHPLLRPERPPWRVRRKLHFALLAEADVAWLDVALRHGEATHALEQSLGGRVHHASPGAWSLDGG